MQHYEGLKPTGEVTLGISIKIYNRVPADWAASRLRKDLQEALKDNPDFSFNYEVLPLYSAKMEE